MTIGLDILLGVLSLLTACWHSWEKHFGIDSMMFGIMDGNFSRWEMEFDKWKGEHVGK